MKTVETVPIYRCQSRATPLKLGVNEIGPVAQDNSMVRVLSTLFLC